MNIHQRQSALGYIGLALLRERLIGRSKLVKQLLKDAELISALPNKDHVSKITKFSVRNGYKIWVNKYDEKGNILIDIEEPIVRSILDQLKKGEALDIACGTGRYSKILKQRGFNVIGTDFSEEMLTAAREKVENVSFIYSDSNNLPFPDNSFDLVICGLGLNQTKRIIKSVNEMSRVLKPSGTIIISNLHPVMISLGFHAEFRDQNGNQGFIQNTPHWASEFIEAFNKNKLKIDSCFEPKIKTKDLDFARKDLDINFLAFSASLKNLPIANIWVLKK